MKKLEILKYPHEALRKKAAPIRMDELGRKAIFELIGDMIFTMKEADGIGLAAPQVGISKQLILVSDDGRNFFEMINPEIVKASDMQTTLLEGCLSFPGSPVQVSRPESVTVRYFDGCGQFHEKKFSGLMAKCIQHEMEHLLGTLIIDHLE